MLPLQFTLTRHCSMCLEFVTVYVCVMCVCLHVQYLFVDEIVKFQLIHIVPLLNSEAYMLGVLQKCILARMNRNEIHRPRFQMFVPDYRCFLSFTFPGNFQHTLTGICSSGLSGVLRLKSDFPQTGYMLEDKLESVAVVRENILPTV